MKQIKCTPGDLDDVREQFIDFSHFTVRNGKSVYHMLTLAKHSCGVYYAWRIGNHGLEGRRALEPLDEIICWGE